MKKLTLVIVVALAAWVIRTYFVRLNLMRTEELSYPMPTWPSEA